MADSDFFENKGPFSLKQLAETGQAECLGDPEMLLKDVAALQDAKSGNITFLSNMKYKEQLAQTKASACIIHPAAQGAAPENLALILSENPYKAYALIAQAFYPVHENTGVHPSAVIDKTAILAENVSVGANAVISQNVRIGKNTYIGANVTLSHAHIGKNCRIFPGVCIGQDGFGFAMDPEGHVTVPQLGRVIIEDYVEIGANTTVDRGAGPDTIIGSGTRIDNLVQIGHNVKIGKNCVIVAQTGISGSTVIEDYAVLAAQSGIAGHITIGKGAQIGAKTGVPSDVEAGAKMMGYPAKPIKEFWKEQVLFKRLLNERKKKLNDGKE